MNVVGTSAKRIDGIEKVTGTAQFTVDIELPRLIHAKVKRSPVPHAEIVRIDTSRAKDLPGVRAVVTGAEIPDVRMGVLTLDEHLLARDRVRVLQFASAIDVGKAMNRRASRCKTLGGAAWVSASLCTRICVSTRGAA